ncbi:putative bifunctional diguanylate cyclase/phosphodiesterase [Marinobacter sp.]|uniref:putative bifunctional diguanylate cyclase/phosphodiesterase n=1 Tax=Marinobacter sp. TaxID=50741 RepID=UPI0034A28932
MVLPEWIRANLESILQRWEDHARSLLSLENLSIDELRDHAGGILLWIADDMEAPRTAQEQTHKSGGTSDGVPAASSASDHGAERMHLGMNALDMVGEFRALRVSVIQLWQLEKRSEYRDDFDDLFRFDQALDQVLAESVKRFTDEKVRQEKVFHTILASSPDPSYILDADGRFLYANNATTALYNTSRAQLIGRSYADLGASVPNDLDAHVRRVYLEKAPLHTEVRMREKAADRQCHEYIHTPVFDNKGQIEAVVGIARDITQRWESEARIWRHANHDALTGLPNRRLFRDRLAQQAKLSERTKAPFTLFFIDLDRFKQVNDLLGHDEGDLLLIQAGERICKCVRETDTVARLGGDEFTVLLIDTDDLDQITKIAGNILTELAKAFFLNQETVYVSGSIGITRYPLDGDQPHQLLRNADQAMYNAKKAGRNKPCIFAPNIEQAATARAQLVSELQGALERQELQLYYQPIIDLSGGRIAKAEALLRWHNPSRGLLLPRDFVQLAEETGLLAAIESWTFSEAVALSKQINDLVGQPFQVSLNISSAGFADHTPSLSWPEQLKEAGVPASSVAIEFTEKVFSLIGNGPSEELSRLGQSGIALAIDDFGMGQSSVVYLKKFNISYLKIPPSYIRNELPDVYSRAIADTIIVMAHKLGLKVIAEGVETPEEKEWLQAAGCDYAQGFLFSKPLPANALKALLRDSSLL